MQTATTVFDCGGTPTAYSSVRQAGEKAGDWAQRHKAGLEQAKKGC